MKDKKKEKRFQIALIDKLVSFRNYLKLKVNILIKFVIYVALLIFLSLLMVYNNKLMVDEEWQNPVVHIIVSFLPMIFTIIAISLSLPNIKIYGLDVNTFRRLKAGTLFFSFIEMISITTTIFAMCTFAETLAFHTALWTLDGISLLFSFLFARQEISILTLNNNYIKRIIKSSYRINTFSNLNSINSSLGINLNTVIKQLLINDGIVETYNLLKKKDSNHNKEWNKSTLETLLEIQHGILVDLTKTIKHSNYYNNPPINDNNVNIIIDNIEKCVIGNSNFDSVKIFEDTRHSRILSYSTVLLKEICDAMRLFKTYEEKIGSITRISLMQTGFSKSKEIDNEKMHIYKFLDYGIISTFQRHDLSFAIILRNNNYNSIFSLWNSEYFFYFSILLYYYCKINKLVDKNFKESILSFIKSKSSGINSDGSSFSTIFSEQLRRLNIEYFINLLPKLLSLNPFDNKFNNLYLPKNVISWNISDVDFNKQIIVDCWIEMVLVNYDSPHIFYKKTITDMTNKLTKDDKKMVYERINEKWLNDNKGLKEIDFDRSFVRLFDSDIPFFNSFNEGGFLYQLSNVINEAMKEEEKEKIKKDAPTEQDLVKYKDLLLSGIDKSASSLPFKDSSLDIVNSPLLYIPIRFETEGMEQLIKFYINEMENYFNNAIYNKVKNIMDKEIATLDSTNYAQIIKKIKENGYDIKTNKLYPFHSLLLSKDEREILDSVKYEKIRLPSTTFLKKGAIKIKVEIDKERSDIRWPTDEEVNTIIEKEYKIVNGLYKYVAYGNEKRKIFLSREEIYNIVKRKYCIGIISFKMRIDVNKNNILIIRL